MNFAGASGVINTAAGVRLAFCSQLADDNDIEALKSQAAKPGFVGVDILLTAQWPLGVLKESPVGPVCVFVLARFIVDRLELHATRESQDG